MEYNQKSQEWAKGFAKGASGQGQIGILKKFFGSDDEDDKALERRRQRKESAAASQDSSDRPG